MAILERVFDKRSKTIRDELAAFEAELRSFEHRIAPASTVLHTRREGTRLRVTVLSAEVRSSTGGNVVEAWRP